MCGRSWRGDGDDAEKFRIAAQQTEVGESDTEGYLDHDGITPLLTLAGK